MRRITARNVREKADFAERWDAVMQVNVKGTLLMCHTAVEAMRRAGSGAIVNLTSLVITHILFSRGDRRRRAMTCLHHRTWRAPVSHWYCDLYLLLAMTYG
jgi:hypothetical protein